MTRNFIAGDTLHASDSGDFFLFGGSSADSAENVILHPSGNRLVTDTGYINATLNATVAVFAGGQAANEIEVLSGVIQHPQDLTLIAYGASAGDKFSGDAEQDIFYGNGGNDTLQSGGGRDSLFGGAGADMFHIVRAYPISDVDIHGGSGNDRIFAEGVSSSLTPLRGRIDGGEGVDSYVGASLYNLIFVNVENLIIYRSISGSVAGLSKFDTWTIAHSNPLSHPTFALSGGGSIDFAERLPNFTGQVHVETLDGRPLNIGGLAGNDTFDGGSGSDTLDGRSGNDVIHDFGLVMPTNKGRDLLIGGDGNDTIFAAGLDTVDAGAGDDSVFGLAGSIDGGDGTDTIIFGGGSTGYFKNFEEIVFKDSTVAKITGSIEEFSHLSSITVDFPQFTPLQVVLTGTGEIDFASILRKGDGVEVSFRFGSSSVNITGTNSADRITGTATDDTLSGGGSLDLLNGHHGDDILQGGSGADVLHGDGGNDTLVGGADNDTLVGGTGSDRFSFASDHAIREVDSISDFAPLDDVLELRGAAFGGLQSGIDATNFHIGAGAVTPEQRLIYDAGTGDLFYDPDGSGRITAMHFATLAPGLSLAFSNFDV